MRYILPVALAFAAQVFGQAQSPSTNHAWRYTLVEGSTFQDDCPGCGRPTIIYPMRGTFDLFLDNVGPLFTTYRITNAQFHTDLSGSPAYTVSGDGTWRVGGQLAVQQSITLNTTSCVIGASCRPATYTNSDAVRLTFPWIEISCTQTQYSLFSVYSMHIVAAPVREVWFVVTNGFSPTNGSRAIVAGDVLSTAGAVVASNAALQASVGVTNAALRTDAFEVAPGAEVLFSLSGKATSPSLGTIQEGDLLSMSGRVARTSQQLTAAFAIQPPVPDVGLDAVCRLGNGDTWFSIRTNIFSQGKGATLHRGDVLSISGVVIKTNQQLLARFHPLDPAADYGLDALNVWPNGEIWFSTESGFTDQQLGPISDGDLLSTEGVVVYKNAELVSTFAAPASATGYGLGDIFVVSNAAAVDGTIRVGANVAGQAPNQILLQWAGSNRVFQVEWTAGIPPAWQPISPIVPALSNEAPRLLGQRFYRIRGW